MLIDFKSVIRNREYIQNPKKREYVEKLVPLEETIRNVDTDYKIISYPHIKKPNLRHLIEYSSSTTVSTMEEIRSR